MDTLPHAVSTGLVLLALLSFLLCALLPFCISAWHFFRHATRQELEEQATASPFEGIIGACIGLFVVDALLYVLTRSTLPKQFFYITLGSINFMVGSFIVYHLFNRYLAFFLLRKSK